MFYFWLNVVLLILAGALSCAGMIAARQPNAGAAISKLVPFQGIIGILALIWGVWGVIDLFRYGLTFDVAPVTTILVLVGIIVLLILGFLLAWSLIARATGGGGQAAAAQAKLAGVQGPLGVVAIIVGLLLLIFYIFSIQI